MTAIKVSRTEMVRLTEEQAGSIVTIGFIKKDKSRRFLTGNRRKNAYSKLGYLLFNDFQDKKDPIKSVDPRTVFSLKTKGLLYELKK